MNTFGSNFIFYLQLGNKVSEEYLRLAMELKAWDIDLVPIHPSEADQVLGGHKAPFFIALTTDLLKMKKFQEMQKGFFNFALRAKKARLIHLNSFGFRSEYNGFRHQDYYVPIQLPAKIVDIGTMVAKAYYRVNGKKNAWPGGRRAKLPSLNPLGES